jgi:putative heme-binding domain-containing protein
MLSLGSLLVYFSLAQPPLVAPSEALSPAEEAAGFQLPKGLKATLVAADPAIYKPMNIAFDDRGRLWVTDTLEYPYPAAQGTKPRDTVKILEDFDPATGQARKVTVFADGLNIPIGLLPLPSGKTTRALVFDIGHLRLLEDTDNDGKADKSTVILSGYGFRDTHGMTNAFTWGLDGSIHATHGFANESQVKNEQGKTIGMQSGHTYRFKADGTGLEVWTRGQVNPFGMAMDDFGHLFTADCHSKPVYNIIKGASYPSFGKPHDGLGFGPEMCPHDHGSTGIAGCCWLPEGLWPGFQETILLGNVVTSRVNRDNLAWTGSSPKAVEQPDLIISKDLWFRPVDIKLGPDGAVYIADFYNKIIGHYEVPLTHPGRDRHRGRIWRIAPEDLAIQIPDLGASAPLARLVEALASSNPAKRVLAANQLALRGEADAVRPLAASHQGPGSALAAWVLQRLGKLDTGTVMAKASHADPLQRTHAMLLLGAAPTPGGEKVLQSGLGDPDRRVARAAAESLAKSSGKEVANALVSALHAWPPEDTHGSHTALIALRDCMAREDTLSQLAREKPTPQALETLCRAALGIPSKDSAAFLAGALVSSQGKQPSPAMAALIPEMARLVARHGSEGELEQLTAWIGGSPAGNREKAGWIKALAQGCQSSAKPVPASLLNQAESMVRDLLVSKDMPARLDGVELAQATGKAKDRLVAALSTAGEAGELRLASLRALLALDAGGVTGLLGQLLQSGETPDALRRECGQALAKSCGPVGLETAAKALGTLPANLQNSVAQELALTPEGSEKLVGLVRQGKTSARVLRERTVETRLAKHNGPWKKDLADLTKGIPDADAGALERIRQVTATFKTATLDTEKGKAVFQKQCATCHQISGQGARIGPQLDGVGIRGAERLLEDILDPSRNVDQAFRTTVLSLKDGKVVSGLLLREEGKTLILADANGKEVRVDSDQVEERSASPLSPMPANILDQVGKEDLAQLIGFLLAGARR